MQADNESFEKALLPQPTKRKRSSILKPPDKRSSRDSRTVSFNEKYYYKELYKDGTCDITNFFISEDMDITMMDIVDPNVDPQNQTIDNSVDMSMEHTIVGSQCVDITLVPDKTTIMHDRTLDEEEMLDEVSKQHLELDQSERVDQVLRQDCLQGLEQQDQEQLRRQQQQHHHHSNNISQQLQPQKQQLDQSRLCPQHTPQKQPPPPQQQQQQHQQQQQQQQQEPSQHQQEKQRQLEQEQRNEQMSEQDRPPQPQPQPQQPLKSSTSPDKTLASMTMVSDISSLHDSNLTDHFANDTLVGAFYETNMSFLSNRTSGVDTLMHNIEALNDCIQKVDNQTDECRRRLDSEMNELFKFYRHIINKKDKYEFAISIFGLRHSLWLIIKINPETYPNEKLRLRFAFNKKDRNLYPFREYAQAVERCTKEGSYGYLTRFVINAQRFRRFLRKVGYRKITN